MDEAENDMARVRFHADYDHHVSRQALVAYKAGHELTVPRAHAAAAIAAGRAVEIEVPPRERRSSPEDTPAADIAPAEQDADG